MLQSLEEEFFQQRRIALRYPLILFHVFKLSTNYRGFHSWTSETNSEFVAKGIGGLLYILLANGGWRMAAKRLKNRLSGGSSQLRFLDEFIKRALGVESFVSEDPLFCVAKGTATVLSHINVYKKTLLSNRR